MQKSWIQWTYDWYQCRSLEYNKLIYRKTFTIDETYKLEIINYLFYLAK